MVVDESDNIVLIDGVNGTPPGDANLCGGATCLRNTFGVSSGQRDDVGCTHAERSAIYRAARVGKALKGHTMIVNSECCLGCAKAIQRVGITKVVYKAIDYPDKSGMMYLDQHGIQAIPWSHYERLEEERLDNHGEVHDSL